MHATTLPGTVLSPAADSGRVLTLRPLLADRRDRLAGTLSGGQQQMTRSAGR